MDAEARAYIDSQILALVRRDVHDVELRGIRESVGYIQQDIAEIKDEQRSGRRLILGALAGAVGSTVVGIVLLIINIAVKGGA